MSAPSSLSGPSYETAFTLRRIINFLRSVFGWPNDDRNHFAIICSTNYCDREQEFCYSSAYRGLLFKFSPPKLLFRLLNFETRTSRLKATAFSPKKTVFWFASNFRSFLHLKIRLNSAFLLFSSELGRHRPADPTCKCPNGFIIRMVAESY